MTSSQVPPVKPKGFDDSSSRLRDRFRLLKLSPLRFLNRALESSNPLVFSGVTGLDVIAHTVTESLAHIERSSVSKRAKPIVSSERLRQSGNLETPQKSPKSKREQVPPRHWVGTYLAYSSSRRGIASSRNRIKKEYG